MKAAQRGFAEVSMAAKLMLYGLLALAITGAVTAAYLHVKQTGRDEVIGELATQTVVVNKARAAIAAPIVQKEAAAQARIVVVTETILKEVPIYVKTTDSPMPGGFRVLHDAAADGRLPNPAAIADAASVPAQDVASTVAANYGTCRQTSQRLTSLQQWLSEQVSLKIP